MRSAEELEAKAAYIEKDRLPAIEQSAEAIELLAKRVEQHDEQLAAHIRRVTTRAHIEMIVSRIRYFIESGNLDQAHQAATNWENHFNFIRDLLGAPSKSAARLRAAVIGGGKRGGQASKRRKWADKLAELLAQSTTEKKAAWALVPNSSDPLEIWSDGELQVYRDGEKIVCAAADKEVGTLTRSTFFKRYFPPPGQ